MKGILKWPLIIAAIVVVLRVVVERAGAPGFVASLFGVFALHLVIGPVYFAIRIGTSGTPRPYTTLLKLVALYAVLTRIMVLPTYWLARIYGWPESRFDGLVDATPLIGYVAIPVVTALVWIVSSVVFGGILGSIVIAIVRRYAMKS